LGHPDHFHLLCRVCGKVIEENLGDLETKLKRMADKHNFVVEDFNIGLHGICKKCQL